MAQGPMSCSECGQPAIPRRFTLDGVDVRFCHWHAHVLAGHSLPVAFHMTQDPVTGDISPAIGGVKPTTGYSTIGVAYGLKEANRKANGWGIDEERAYTLDGQGRGSVATPAMAVRRLLPVETLRLQGFPDDHFDGLGLADSVKYRMVGNAVAVPVVTWIARRLCDVARTP